MTRKCSKKTTALSWALLECMFFSSVVLGWTWLSIVFRSDAYFSEQCNVTYVNVTSTPKVSDSMRSVDVMAKIESEAYRNSRKRKKPCRPRRSDEGGVISMIPDDDEGRENDRSGEGDILLVDDDTDIRVEMRPTLRIKRAGTTNLSTLISSLQSNQLSAASITQTDQDDVIGKKGGMTFEKHVLGYCLPQNEQIRVMFAVVVIIRDVLTFPLGVFFDKYGTTRTRLLTV